MTFSVSLNKEKSNSLFDPNQGIQETSVSVNKTTLLSVSSFSQLSEYSKHSLFRQLVPLCIQCAFKCARCPSVRPVFCARESLKSRPPNCILPDWNYWKQHLTVYFIFKLFMAHNTFLFKSLFILSTHKCQNLVWLLYLGAFRAERTAS